MPSSFMVNFKLTLYWYHQWKTTLSGVNVSKKKNLQIEQHNLQFLVEIREENKNAGQIRNIITNFHKMFSKSHPSTIK